MRALWRSATPSQPVARAAGRTTGQVRAVDRGSGILLCCCEQYWTTFLSFDRLKLDNLFPYSLSSWKVN